MKVKIVKQPENFDSDSVYFYDDAGHQIGFGYKPKKNKANKVCLIRCPKCERENYALIVASGFCGWCGYSYIVEK